jgi:hypothetical protein
MVPRLTRKAFGEVLISGSTAYPPRHGGVRTRPAFCFREPRSSSEASSISVCGFHEGDPPVAGPQSSPRSKQTRLPSPLSSIPAEMACGPIPIRRTPGSTTSYGTPFTVRSKRKRTRSRKPARAHRVSSVETERLPSGKLPRSVLRHDRDQLYVLPTAGARNREGLGTPGEAKPNFGSLPGSSVASPMRGTRPVH